jgi:hypothetical protein
MTVQLALGRLEDIFFFNFEDPIFFLGAMVEVLDQLLSIKARISFCFLHGVSREMASILLSNNGEMLMLCKL